MFCTSLFVVFIHATTEKCCEGQTHELSDMLLPQGREGIRGEDKRFNVTVGHNNTNCGAGARARMPNPHINNPQGATNPRVRNPVAPSSKHLLSQNKHKANNRNKQSELISFIIVDVLDTVYIVNLANKKFCRGV